MGVVKKFQSWTYAPDLLPRCKHKTVLTMFTVRVYCFRFRGKMRVVSYVSSAGPRQSTRKSLVFTSNPFACHTYETCVRKSFPCHTSKIAHV